MVKEIYTKKYMKKLFFIVGIVMLLSLTVLESNVYAATITSNAVAGRAISIALVNQDPDPVQAGNTFDIRLSVSNSGSASVGGLVVEVVPTYPFMAVDGESYVQTTDLNAFQSGSESQILKYTLRVNKEATQGTYYLNVKYYGSGDNSSVVMQTVAVSVGNSQSVEIIHIDKTVLIPGKQSDMKFVINNVGSASLKNLKFYWKNTDGVILPVGSDNTKYIKYLDVGDSAEVDYQVIADTNADAGLYPLDLYLSYKDSTNADVVVNTLAGVYVGGTTDFDVAFSDSTTGTTSFTIANIGSNPATSVSVVIPEQRGWSVLGSNSMIIGNLDKGDYTIASFKLQQFGSLRNITGDRTSVPERNFTASGVSGAGSPSNNLIIQIAYTDTMGERNIVNKTVKVSSSSSNQTVYGAYAGRPPTTTTKSYSIYVIIVIVVLIAAFAGYRYYRKNKLLGSDNKDMKQRRK